MATNRKPILCLDFDGVLHSYTSGWQGAHVVGDPPVPGAVQFLVDASEQFTLYVHSSRSNQSGGINAMSRALANWFADEIPNAVLCLSGDLLVVTIDDHEVRVHFAREKPPALVTLDDRAVTFTGTWPSLDELAAFKPWNKR